jgi:hypothetical protein
MTKKEKIKLIKKEIKRLKKQLETTDDILTINTKILRYELIKNKLEEEI